MTLLPKTRRMNISRKTALCPCCGSVCRRHAVGCRRLHEIGVERPVDVEVTYSKHYCARCRKHFSVDMTHLAPAGGRFTHRVRRTAVDLVVGRGMTLDEAAYCMLRRYFVHTPPTTVHDWVKEALLTV